LYGRGIRHEPRTTVRTPHIWELFLIIAMLSGE